MNLDLEKTITVTIKITEKGHKAFGEKREVYSTIRELSEESISTILIDEDVFESMGHPCDHYDLLSIDY